MAEKKTERAPAKQEAPSDVAERGDPVTGLRQEIDRLFDDFGHRWATWGGPRGPAGARWPRWMEAFGGAAPGWRVRAPAVDMVDKEKEIVVKAELPGMDEGDIDVQLSDSLLKISGEKKEEREKGEKDSDYYLSERRYGSFERAIPLPEGIDQGRVKAAFRKGVLTVTLPKTREAQKKMKKVEVKGSKE